MRSDTGKKFHFDNIYWEHPKQFGMFSLYQIGDLSCRGGYEVGAHVQPCYEITYILSGKGTCLTNGIPHSVKKGDVFLSRPQEVHNLIADTNDPFRYLYLAFVFNKPPNELSPYEPIEKLFNRLSFPVIYNLTSIESPFLNALQEFYTRSEYAQTMIKSYILQVIMLTYRSICTNIEQKNRQTYHLSTMTAQEIVYAVVSYIDLNLYTIVNLKQIAETLSYSYSHLSHIFRESTGMTLQTYYQSRRMALGGEMIRAGTESISHIANKLQYQSIHRQVVETRDFSRERKQPVPAFYNT